MSKKMRNTIITGSIILSIAAAGGGIWLFRSQKEEISGSATSTTEAAVPIEVDSTGSTERYPENTESLVSSIRETASTIASSDPAVLSTTENETDTTQEPSEKELPEGKTIAASDDQTPVTAVSKETNKPVTLTEAAKKETSAKATTPTESTTEAPKETITAVKPSNESSKKNPTEKPAADSPGKTETPTTETVAAKKPSTGKASTEKPSAESSSTEKPSTEKASSEKASSEKTATEQPSTEKPKCAHTWIWKTHTETKVIPAVTHQVPIYNDGWDEAVKVRKILCTSCQKLYEDLDDYYDHDFCFGSFGHKTVIDHYIHHEPELLDYDTIVDEPEHEETITVKDYEYCSICGVKK